MTALARRRSRLLDASEGGRPRFVWSRVFLCLLRRMALTASPIAAQNADDSRNPTPAIQNDSFLFANARVLRAEIIRQS
jgi:hypothetical protein